MLAASKTDHAQRFAKKSAEASRSYANAGTFAGLHAFNALCDSWTDACAEAANPPKPGSKSWFRDPAKADLFDPWTFWSQAGGNPANLWVPDLWFGQNNMMAQVWSPLLLTSPSSPLAAIWAEFLPKPYAKADLSFTRSPFWDTAAAALPMTWSLMSFGMPHAVAKSTAEANTAALEAFDSAQQVASEHIEAYALAMDSVAKEAASHRQAGNPFEAYSALFWPWLDDAPAADAQKASDTDTATEAKASPEDTKATEAEITDA